MGNRAVKLTTLALASVAFVGAAAMPDPIPQAAPPQDVPPPDVEPIQQAPAPRRSFSALTSFDGSTEMTSGERDLRIASSSRTFPPAPAQWNNPIQWLSTHRE